MCLVGVQPQEGHTECFGPVLIFPSLPLFFLYLLYFGMASGRVVFGLASCCHHLDKIMKLNDLKRAILYYY